MGNLWHTDPSLRAPQPNTTVHASVPPIGPPLSLLGTHLLLTGKQCEKHQRLLILLETLQNRNRDVAKVDCNVPADLVGGAERKVRWES